jgi:hypothetical protein
MTREIIGWSFIKDRRTDQPVGLLTPVYKEDWPYDVPAPDQRIWRYVDLWKFEDMLRTSSLYFRRADKLLDVGEGRLSTEGVRGTAPSEIAFKAAYNIAPQGHVIDVAAHEVTRSCMFINCWNIGDVESARMWAEYTTSSESVAISTTFDQLIGVLPNSELIISRVKYIDDTTPRCEFFHTTPFFYKDKGLSFENELRLVRPLLDGERVLKDDERDLGKLVRVGVPQLIERIVTNKNMPQAAVDVVRRLAKTYCPSAQVLASEIEPSVLLTG